jgi:5-methylcytosine-specific restriction endonuclease McrA
MKAHTKIYFNYFGYDATDFISCEICGKMANDIHHIHARGMGGSKQADNIENLMALCRNCHIDYGDKKQYIEFLNEIHNKKICDKSV